MPQETTRWKTLQALKNSPKGNIRYDPRWSERGEDILEGCKENISLSSSFEVTLDCLNSLPLQKSFYLDSSSEDSSPGLPEEISASVSSTESITDINTKDTTHLETSPLRAKTEQFSGNNVLQTLGDEAKDEDPEVDSNRVSSPASLPAISLLSPKAMEMAGRIIKFEREQREKAKAALKLRQEMQEKLVATVANSELEQLKRFEEFLQLKQRQEHQSMRDMIDRGAKESIGRQEKLKEEQRHRIKTLNLRLREAEQQRLREAELQRQRQSEGQDRLRNLNTIQEEILQLNQLLDPSTQTKADLPLAVLNSLSTRGNQLCSQVSAVVTKTAEGDYPSVEDMTAAERALHEMRQLIRLMQEEVAKGHEKKRKEEEKRQEDEQKKQLELQAQQEAQKKAAQSAREKAQRRGLQTTAEDSTLKWYEGLQHSAAQCAQSFESFLSSKDARTKKVKQGLQKAATIPVSQISSVSGSKLREVFDKLEALLSGQAVQLQNESVSTSQHPQGRDYVCYKMAEKFVTQGQEEVASNHKSAFPIATVASGIWERHPQVGDLILAHLHKKCPYSIPHYPPMKEGTTIEEYQQILGYRVTDSGVEGQDSFLKRMSGMIRLYAATIQLRWPYNPKQESSPHGLNHGWRWLAQMLNMEPLADITATLLFDFLEVCGHALMKQYQGQFWKLILLIKEEYIQRIEAATSDGQMGSVSRLKEFLETSLHSRHISPPKGQLDSMFWRS